MHTPTHWIVIILVAILLGGCGSQVAETETAAVEEVEKGPHGGRLLRDGDFTLELAIFETGVPPEFRAWASRQGRSIAPGDIELRIELTRLGGKVDRIGFTPQDDFLRGDLVVYEPHSFVVAIKANHGGATHRWQYDNLEGRTRISTEMAEAFGIQTQPAGPALIEETISAFGRISADPQRVREVSARFPGLIETVNPALGERVKKGQTLATIESNESLKSYSVKAPISGIITRRDANPGEQAGERPLLTITDTRRVWADLSVFPADRARLRPGAKVLVTGPSGQAVTAEISQINVVAETNQAVIARAVLDNPEGAFLSGDAVTARITLASHTVPLAVKRTGLQAFRDFTVVYAQIGEDYEVRMLELGRQDETWAEVLGGLDPGTRYVSENSYLIKADIEKAGAAHDH